MSKDKKSREIEIRNELHKAAEGYDKAKQEIPQLGWGGVIGQKDFIRGLGDAFRLPFTMATTTYSIIKKSFKPDPRNPLPTESTDPKERFSVAMDLYGLNDEDIDTRMKSSSLIFYLCFIGIFIDLFIYLYVSWINHNMFSFSIFPMFSLAFWLTSQMFKYGLVNFQMRNKALFPAKDYIKNNQNWFPPLNFKGKMATFMVIGLIGMSMAAPAFAATNSTSISEDCGVSEASNVSVENVLTIPCNKDLWLQSLARLFPGVGPLDSVNTGSTQTYGAGFVNALAAFVAIITAVAVGSLSYQSCIAIVNTAVDGDTLGQKWHKVWAPIRICYGFGMLAPITKGGVCMAQVFVVYIALWSGNWGSLVYKAYIDGVQNPQMNSGIKPPETGSTFSALVKMNLCWSSEKSRYTKEGNGDKWPDWGKSAGTPKTNAQRPLNVFDGGYGGESGSRATFYVPPSSDIANHDVLQAAGTETVSWDFGPCGQLETQRVKTDGWAMRLTSFLGNNPGSLIPGSLMATAHNWNQALARAQPFYTKRESYINTLNNSIHNAMDGVIDALFKDQDQDSIEKGDDPLGKAIGEVAASDGPLMKAFTEYNSNVTAALQDAANVAQASDASKKDFDETVKNNGWMVAGSYYVTVARMTNVLNSYLSEEPAQVETTGEGDNVSTDLSSLGQDGKGYMDKVSKLLTTLSIEANPVNVNQAVTGSKADSATGAAGDKEAWYNGASGGFGLTGIRDVYLAHGPIDAWRYACNGLSFFIERHLAKMISVEPGQGSAITQMIDFGHDIIDIAYAIFFAALFMRIFGSILGKISTALHIAKGVLDAALTVVGFGPAAADEAESATGAGLSYFVAKNAAFVASMIFSIGLMILFVGILYAYVFPMMPYINFLFFEQGTLMLVAECMIAAPILAYLHVRGEGEQLVDQVQKTGYMILFNLFLRIPLGIFGLVLSIGIFEVSVWLNSILFQVAWNAAVADNASGIIGIMMYLILIVYIEWQLAVKSFSMISTLPQKIARWFGAASEDHGEAAGMKEFFSFAAGQNIGSIFKDGGKGIAGALAKPKASPKEDIKTPTGGGGKGGGKMK